MTLPINITAMTEIRSVHTDDDIASVAMLAHDIWNQHYGPIIGQQQTDYMLATFQSPTAIDHQIATGHQYYLVMSNGVPAGYFAIVPNPTDRSTLLSKIYVDRDQRGKGLGTLIIAFVESRCAELGFRELWLTVNRHNADSIAFYRHVGFVTAGTVVQEVGHGFVMDDYKMIKKLVFNK